MIDPKVYQNTVTLAHTIIRGNKCKEPKTTDLVAATAWPNSCTETDMMVEIHIYPASASDNLKPGCCIRGS